MTLKSTLATVAVLTNSVTMAQAETYRVGVDAGFPPFSEVKGDGSVVGLEVDFTNELCKRMNAECEIVPMQFDALIAGLQARQIDMIVGSMSITAERAEVINFSNSYYNAPIQFVSKIGAAGDVPASASVGVERGSISASYAENELAESKIATYDSQLAAMQDLEVGRVDYALGDLLTIYDWLEVGAKDTFALVGEPISDPKHVGDGIGIGLRKSEEALLGQVNATITEMHADGSFDAISANYFPFSIR